MKYLTRLLEKSQQSSLKGPTKPTKPPSEGGETPTSLSQAPYETYETPRQGTVKTDETPRMEAPAPPPWHRPAALGHWPVAWRQQWADRCAALEAEGIPYPEHERQAFLEVADQVDPHARLEAPPREPEHPLELADGTLVFDPADPYFGIHARPGADRGVTRQQLEASTEHYREFTRSKRP